MSKHMVSVLLKKADADDAEEIHRMQIASFAELYAKYSDHDTNPGNETVERVRQRLDQPFTYYYFICADECKVGAVRIVDKKDKTPKKISPIFILPEHRGNGYAKKAIELCELIHGSTNWELSTILQEKGLCLLYESLGYKQTCKTERISKRMDLVYYRK